MVSRTVKIEVVAPMPIDSVSAAAMAKTGARRSERHAKVSVDMRDSMGAPTAGVSDSWRVIY